MGEAARLREALKRQEFFWSFSRIYVVVVVRWVNKGTAQGCFKDRILWMVSTAALESRVALRFEMLY